MHPANERWRYNVTSSLIGWVHAQNDPCIFYDKMTIFKLANKIAWIHSQHYECRKDLALGNPVDCAQENNTGKNITVKSLI